MLDAMAGFSRWRFSSIRKNHMVLIGAVYIYIHMSYEQIYTYDVCHRRTVCPYRYVYVCVYIEGP